MDNKLSELSKPVATVDVQRGRMDGNTFAVAWSSAGHALPDGPHFIYSQEYVSALQHESAVNWEAQPVGYIDPESLKEYRGQRAGGTWSAVQRTTSGLNMTTPIYTVPPAPAVPEKCPEHVRSLMNIHADDLFDDADAQEIWNACRAAMLAEAPEGGSVIK
ncbi:hypothetical protein [Serratia ureilytica]|uniref:hypothetical protein n=1 Tax=Serratia ureilytica TaxID=300181 RepID=UPI001867DA30|nr:hypothetical protein [Serratia ureilytica]